MADDDDDWAPESIEWTDGTKITLAQTDEQPASAPAHEPAPGTASTLKDITVLEAIKPKLQIPLGVQLGRTNDV